MIAGTSMGAIVGGLYAIGYTPEQLDSMVRKQDWTFLLSDRIKRSAMSLTDRERSEKYTVSIPFTKTPKDAATGGIMKGENLANLFSDLTVGYHDSINFNKLPIPFPNAPKKTIQSLRKTGERIAVNSVVVMLYHASRNKILS